MSEYVVRRIAETTESDGGETFAVLGFEIEPVERRPARSRAEQLAALMNWLIWGRWPGDPAPEPGPVPPWERTVL